MESLRLGAVFMLLYGLALLGLVTTTQTLKYTIKRQRPDYLPHIKRWGKNLRGVEHGTFSMPSGDSYAAAVFCMVYWQLFGEPAVWLILPLVCCGRVYYQCHWFGDTLAGSIVGAFWGKLIVSYFGIFLVFFRAVASSEGAFISR